MLEERSSPVVGGMRSSFESCEFFVAGSEILRDLSFAVFELEDSFCFLLVDIALSKIPLIRIVHTNPISDSMNSRNFFVYLNDNVLHRFSCFTLQLSFNIYS